ncbi:MAG: PhoPQ-activated pathogenicity-related family protein [Gammaproteobacteria bacterium]
MDHYINATDSHYRWRPIQFSNETWGTIGRYELISQNWRGHTWKHRVIIVRPRTVRNTDVAFLEIAGDGDGERHLDNLRILAERGGSIAAVVMNVPNQPLYQNRREDALIAYTFNQYIRTGDESWPLLFPMVKSAVRAMDAIQAIAGIQHDQHIRRFVVSGASKRGWTTWLAAAVDTRIAAIAPMVIDTLNMKEQLQWSEQIYGRQSSKLKDYTELNLHRKMDSQPMRQLRSWVDPYAYIERFTMPKLILLGTNDPYWTVDSMRFYWHDLPEPKLIHQTANAGHDLNGGRRARQTLAAFFELIADRKPLPKVTWRFNGTTAGNRVNAAIEASQKARAIRLWQAYSDDRDFRNDIWTFQPLNIMAGSSHAATSIPAPQSGYLAFLLEAELKTDSGHDYTVSTMAGVTPDTKPCHCWLTDGSP